MMTTTSRTTHAPLVTLEHATSVARALASAHFVIVAARVAFAVGLVVSTVVLTMPVRDLPDAPPGSDVVVHVLIFAALTGAGWVAGVAARPLLAGLLFYALLTEGLQDLLPFGRTAEAMDVVTNAVSVGATSLLCAAWRRGAGGTRSAQARPASRP
jgi:hypothetical protein